MYCPQNQRLAQIPVGAGLPAKAVCQSIILQLNHRYRRQASSHISHVLPTKSAPGSAPVGAGLLAKALCQSMTLQLNHRFRRQASSHIGHVLPTKSAPGSDPYGSGLARESAVSVNDSSTEPPLSQASHPHWPCIAHKISAWLRSLWERACPRRRCVSQ